MSAVKLLNSQDPEPVRYFEGKSVSGPFVLLGDHAGTAIPGALGTLGLGRADRARHIAVDIGVETLGRLLADRLDAPFVSQAYSRLVVDCNRDPADDSWIVTESDGTAVPGNRDLTVRQRQARREEIFDPYHRAIGALLERRGAAGQETILIALHSFTPAMGGKARPWHVGILHDSGRTDFALRVLAELGASSLTIGDNEPYRMDATDYTVPRHAYPRALSYCEIEFRQDWLAAEMERAADMFAASCLRAR